MAFENKLLTSNSFQLIDIHLVNPRHVGDMMTIIEKSSKSMLHYFLNFNTSVKLSKLNNQLNNITPDVLNKDNKYVYNKVASLVEKADDFLTFEYLSQSFRKKDFKYVLMVF